MISYDRHYLELQDGSVAKESACNARDTGDSVSIPGSERFPRGGNGNSLEYSCLENPLHRDTAKMLWNTGVSG